MLYNPNRQADYSNSELELVEKVNAMYRFGAWCIDTISILFLYLSFIVIFLYNQAPYLGSTYSMITEISPDKYRFVGQDDRFFFYFFIVLFYVFNILYYFIYEVVGNGATFGLKTVSQHKIKLVCGHTKEKAPIELLVMRQLCFVFIAFMTWFFSYYSNCCYFVAIILNILIMYASVFGGKKQSLLGCLTDTYYIIEKQEKQIAPKECDKSYSFKMPNEGNEELKNGESKQNREIFQDDEKQQNNENMLSWKKIFPFNEGFKRLLIVLWLLISLFVEVINWEIYGYSIDNCAMGLIPLFSLPVFYFMFLWVYYGFKK